MCYRYARASVRDGGRDVRHVDSDGALVRDARGAVRERQPPLRGLHAAAGRVGHVPGHPRQAWPASATHQQWTTTPRQELFIVNALTSNRQWTRSPSLERIIFVSTLWYRKKNLLEIRHSTYNVSKIRWKMGNNKSVLTLSSPCLPSYMRDKAKSKMYIYTPKSFVPIV